MLRYSRCADQAAADFATPSKLETIGGEPRLGIALHITSTCDAKVTYRCEAPSHSGRGPSAQKQRHKRRKKRRMSEPLRGIEDVQLRPRLRQGCSHPCSDAARLERRKKSIELNGSRTAQSPPCPKVLAPCALRPSPRCTQALRGGASTHRRVGLRVSGCLRTSLPYREVGASAFAALCLLPSGPLALTALAEGLRGRRPTTSDAGRAYSSS